MENQQEIKKIKNPFYKKWWFGVIVVFVILIAISPYQEKKPSTNQPANTDISNVNTNTNTTSERKITSIVFAEAVIKDILKAPSTAKFVDVEAYELSNEKDVWAVNGYVDSQNSFSAMIRNQWEVQLDYREGKGGTVKSILFDGKKIQ
ncbi:MAG: hypothetical protein WCL13_03995 [bacterium]